MQKVETIKPYGDSQADTKEKQVEAMFDNIAPAYDFMNHAMTAGLDRLWLARLLKQVAGHKPEAIADFATGTGDVALALAKRLPQASITGLDLSEGMLAKARAKARAKNLDIAFHQADCTATQLPANHFDAVTIAYGIRNFADIAAGYAEMHRILRPGAHIHVLELSTPTAAWAKPIYRLYTSLAIPALGSIMAGDRRAYAYLPQSIEAAPQRQQMAEIIARAGFTDVSFQSLTFGVCTLYTATKPLEPK